MRRILGIMLFALITFNAQPSQAVNPNKPRASVHLTSMANDSCVCSGKNSAGQTMTITVRRVPVDRPVENERPFSFRPSMPYRWEAVCRNACLHQPDLWKLGEIAYDNIPDNEKFLQIAKHLTTHNVWSERTETLYVL